MPLYQLTWQLAAALAFGNTVIIKPHELTSMTAYGTDPMHHDKRDIVMLQVLTRPSLRLLAHESRDTKRCHQHYFW
jgi:NAD-dependent aldehyde dehydrogenases